METAEEFASTVMQAIEDDHLLSRDALPTFIADVIRARDSAIRLALLDELETRSAGLIPYPLREYMRLLRAKYTQRTAATETDLAGLDPHTT